MDRQRLSDHKVHSPRHCECPIHGSAGNWRIGVQYGHLTVRSSPCCCPKPQRLGEASVTCSTRRATVNARVGSRRDYLHGSSFELLFPKPFALGGGKHRRDGVTGLGNKLVRPARPADPGIYESVIDVSQKILSVESHELIIICTGTG